MGETEDVHGETPGLGNSEPLQDHRIFKDSCRPGVDYFLLLILSDAGIISRSYTNYYNHRKTNGQSKPKVVSSEWNEWMRSFKNSDNSLLVSIASDEVRVLRKNSVRENNNGKEYLNIKLFLIFIRFLYSNQVYPSISKIFSQWYLSQ
jgi:hypothetical protein